MNYKISEDRKTLTISVDAAERQELREMEAGDGQGCGSVIGTDDAMHDWFDSLIANSELQWIDPADTGDLTSAPMLGILGEPEPGAGGILAGRWPDKAGITQGWFMPVLERWAFMDYQVRSVLEDLRDKGKAIFIS